MAQPPTLTLTAPLSGVLVPLERVPDPVFAERMVGDGVSLEPSSQCLVAPCDGRVAHLHPAGHAVTLTTREGIEVLMHIGLDTVRLKGEGFTPRVQPGDRVRRGDPLVDFDAAFVATHARSLLTQIVVTNGDRVASVRPHSGRVAAGVDPVLDLTLADGVVSPRAGAASPLVSDTIVVGSATGLHARPAAVLAAAAKRFRADVRIRRGATEANARSVVAIMGLEIGQGDTVRVVADGPDAQAALDTIGRLLREDTSREAPALLTQGASIAPAGARRSSSADDPDVLSGVPAAPGLAIGRVLQVRQDHLAVAEQADDAHAERRRLDAALEGARRQVAALQSRLVSPSDAGRAAILAAHAELLLDPDLAAVAESAIAKGRSAAYAWQHAVAAHADRLATLKNELLAQRANDLRDVGRRVLRLLVGTSADRAVPPRGTILVAEELSPSETAALDRSRVLGFCTTAGGATSHVAILARSLDVPMVAGIDPRALELADGTPVILDGHNGCLRLKPSPEQVHRVEALQRHHAERRRADLAAAHDPAVTIDGTRVHVVANLGNAVDASRVVSAGGEGVGLLRSEFLFLDRATAPDEDEQAEAYTRVARALGPGRRLVVRTLDIGGDKPLPYAAMPAEDNPFLGERGIRLALGRPDLLRTQLRAILRAASLVRLGIVFPMVASLAEWRLGRAMLEDEREALGAPPVEAGIVVEVPAAAILAERFAREADFLSVGTNDLTQYTLAMDRGHPKLAAVVDGLDPAVLQLIARTVRAGQRHGKRVGVCGGIADDPQAVPLLVGMGVDELSVSIPAIPAVKAQVRTLSRARCRALARRALHAESATDVRGMVPPAEVLDREHDTAR